MPTITSRKPADIRPGDIITAPDFLQPHKGAVLSEPETKALEVSVLLQCVRCDIAHTVTLAATRVVAVERTMT